MLYIIGLGHSLVQAQRLEFDLVPSRSTSDRTVVPSEPLRLKNILSGLLGQELDARFCRLGRDPIQLGQATSCCPPATSDDHCLTFFQSLGRWCFGCFNLRRDGQCDSNVDPVLSTSTTLFSGCHPCLNLNYKASRYPISSTPDFSSGTLHCFLLPCYQINHLNLHRGHRRRACHLLPRRGNHHYDKVDIAGHDSPLISIRQPEVGNRLLSTNKQALVALDGCIALA